VTEQLFDASRTSRTAVYAATVASLERAVDVLTRTLNSLVENKVAALSPQWATDVAASAEALAKACKALDTVSQL
jgi:hypothetical protein